MGCFRVHREERPSCHFFVKDSHGVIMSGLLAKEKSEGGGFSKLLPASVGLTFPNPHASLVVQAELVYRPF